MTKATRAKLQMATSIACLLQTELDVSVLELDVSIDLMSDFPVARNLPFVSPETRRYIIGHPCGGTLSL